MYQSNAFRRRFAVAYSERAGRGRWRPSQLPTNTSGHLKYDVKMGKQHREIKWSGRSEPRSFQSPCGWIFSQRLSVIGELLEKGWSSGSQATWSPSTAFDFSFLSVSSLFRESPFSPLISHDYEKKTSQRRKNIFTILTTRADVLQIVHNTTKQKCESWFLTL